jgi:aspartyl protease family protein
VEKGPRKARSWTFRLLVMAIVLTVIVGWAAWMSGGGPGDMDWAAAIAPAVILILMAMRFATSAQPLGHMARQLSLFVALGVILVVGYSYRGDLNSISVRVLGTLVPARGTEIAPGMLRFEADNSGQFVVNAQVNGTSVRFLVDTGASGIALSRRDAERLGFDDGKLDYNTAFSTANGMTRGAPVTLNAVQVGPLTAHDVRAWVNEGDLGQSLLGMSYLSTLGRIEIKGDTLILER